MAGETSRVNGRKSRGPRTAFGKARARRNALRHGLAAQTLGSAAPTPRTLALALELAGLDAVYPQVLRAALDLAQAEEMLAAVGRERQRVLQWERDKAERVATLCDGLDASLSLLPGPQHGARDDVGERAALALQEAIASSSLHRPGLPPALQAWASGATELLRLERYHRRAFGRRERAHAQLRKALAAADHGNAGPADPGLLSSFRRSIASQESGFAPTAAGRPLPDGSAGP